MDLATADVYRALWRHKAFIIILTACLTAAAWFLTSRQTAIYEASTLIRVQQRIDDPSQTVQSLVAAERLAQTYANIAETHNVAQRIFSELEGEVPLRAIAGKVSADPVRDLELLWVRARSSNPERAQQIANAAPAALQSWLKSTGTESDQVTVAEQAAIPTEPASPNLKLNLALAALLGLIFNGALALLIEVFGDRVHDPEELERLTGQSILTTVPVLQFRQRSDIEQPEVARRARRGPIEEVVGG